MASLLCNAQRLQSTFKLVLASGSPRRRELLGILGIPFDVVTSGFPEDLNKAEFSPADYVVENARKKCEAVLATVVATDDRLPLVIGADTVVVAQGRILEKPSDSAEARTMLRSLSGGSSEVLTGLAVGASGLPTRIAVERTTVQFADLADEEIDAYIATGEPFDKAGGYGIQSKGCLLVRCIEGDYFNVVGLPLRRLAHLLSDQLSAKMISPEGAPPHKMRKAEYIDKLALVLVRDRRQLVAKTRGKDVFFTPGGKRESGESDQAALIREVREELSVELQPESIKPYGIFEAQAFGKPAGTSVRMTCYTADLNGEPKASNEIGELKWISSGEDRGNLSTTGIMILEDLRSRGFID